MATTKKKGRKPTKKTAASVYTELKARGLRLPHGYEVVKRTPVKKKKTAVKKAAKKTAKKAVRKRTAKKKK